MLLPHSDEHTKLMQSGVDDQSEDGKDVTRPPPTHSIQNNIQTLRAIAIWFVLLFHVWSKRFTHGYLGVDIFFVISGYLMCLILSRKRPINLPVCVDFYYRRVKRIVPLYYTVILVVLVALRHVISPIEFTQLYEEAIPALGFYSNIPNMREAAYFDISSELYYFLHSWSLSVELQFYLIVPLIFVFFDRIEKLRLSLRLSLICRRLRRILLVFAYSLTPPFLRALALDRFVPHLLTFASRELSIGRFTSLVE